MSGQSPFGKFMSTKRFHPQTFDNQKRVWIAEQKAKVQAKEEKQRLDDYRKEQAIHNAKGFALMSREQSAKELERHSVSFLYEGPAAFARRDEEKLVLSERDLPLSDKIPALKGAPRPKYAKDLPAHDKPFGIEVRNVRCMRCGAYGHQNTDRVCPKYGKSREGEEDEAAAAADEAEIPNLQLEDPAMLMQQMQQKSGLMLSQRVLGRINDPTAANQQILTETQEDADAAFLASLTDAEKRKLFRKLEKLERGKKEKKKSKKKKSKKHGEKDDDSDDGAESKKKSKKKKSKKQKKKSASGSGSSSSSDSSSDSSSSDSEDEAGSRKRKREDDEWQETKPSGGAAAPAPPAPPAGTTMHRGSPLAQSAFGSDARHRPSPLARSSQQDHSSRSDSREGSRREDERRRDHDDRTRHDDHHNRDAHADDDDERRRRDRNADARRSPSPKRPRNRY